VLSADVAMADPVDIKKVIGLPPEDTVRAFDARADLRTSVRWSEMFHDDHARAFTVAKVAKLDLLETIRTSLADVIHNGGTFEQWQKNIIPDLQRAGWWGRVVDPELTGTGEAVYVGPRRLRTIFDTNLRVSRAAGQWARIQESKAVSPYLRYSTVMDRRTRPLHRRWHGTILPVDHPWWDTHYPPCGWNCRCTVLQLSDRDLKGYGWTVSEPPRDGAPRRFFPAGAAEPVLVPPGIDPGFAYNPGKASMRAIADKAARSIEQAAGHNIAGARAALRDLVDSPAFLKAMDEPGTSFPVMVLDEAVRGAIGASKRVAVLSAQTFAKQKEHHPEIGIEHYRQLPAIGAAPELIFQQDAQRVILMRSADGKWLKGVLKATVDGSELYVVSLAYADRKELRRLQRRFPLLLGQITGAIAAFIASSLEDDDEGEAEA